MLHSVPVSYLNSGEHGPGACAQHNYFVVHVSININQLKGLVSCRLIWRVLCWQHLVLSTAVTSHFHLSLASTPLDVLTSHVGVDSTSAACSDGVLAAALHTVHGISMLDADGSRWQQ